MLLVDVLLGERLTSMPVNAHCYNRVAVQRLL